MYCCIALHDVRVLNSKTVYFLVWFQDPVSPENVNLSPWPRISLVSVLEFVSIPPDDLFANTVSLAKMTITASTASKLCGRSRSECCDACFPTWNLVQCLSIYTLVWMSTQRIKADKCEHLTWILSFGQVWNWSMRIVDLSGRAPRWLTRKLNSSRLLRNLKSLPPCHF